MSKGIVVIGATFVDIKGYPEGKYVPAGRNAGTVYAEIDGSFGICPPINVAVVDTTGAGDAFLSGVTIGLTYGKTLGEACHIGARLASSVISTRDNVCPRFMPEEFELKVDRF